MLCSMLTPFYQHYTMSNRLQFAACKVVINPANASTDVFLNLAEVWLYDGRGTKIPSAALNFSLSESADGNNVNCCGASL